VVRVYSLQMTLPGFGAVSYRQLL